MRVKRTQSLFVTSKKNNRISPTKNRTEDSIDYRENLDLSIYSPAVEEGKVRDFDKIYDYRVIWLTTLGRFVKSHIWSVFYVIFLSFWQLFSWIPIKRTLTKTNDEIN